MRKLRKFFGILFVMVIIVGSLTNSALAASGSRYYHTTDFSTDIYLNPLEQAQLNSIRSNLNNLFYANSLYQFPSAASIHTGLPYAYISVVHGHGLPGYIVCEQSNGSTQYLYNTSSNTNSLSKYAAGTLNDVKIIMFLNCYSGVGPAGNTTDGFPVTAVNKGASFAVGFRGTVRGSEWWGNAFTAALNSYTVAGAMSMADMNYAYDWPAISGTAVSPNYTYNRITAGTVNSYVWNL